MPNFGHSYHVKCCISAKGAIRDVGQALMESSRRALSHMSAPTRWRHLWTKVCSNAIKFTLIHSPGFAECNGALGVLLPQVVQELRRLKLLPNFHLIRCRSPLNFRVNFALHFQILIYCVIYCIDVKLDFLCHRK